MTTDADKIIARAERLGREHGRASGSWVIDGNTTAETARRIVAGYEDGDPEIMDMQPRGVQAVGGGCGRLGAEHAGASVGDGPLGTTRRVRAFGAPGIHGPGATLHHPTQAARYAPQRPPGLDQTGENPE